MNHDVVVIGGGVVGAACAREFAHRGLTVHLLDHGTEAGMATTAAAGLLAPLVETSQDDPLLSLTVLGRDLYRELAPALHEATGIDIGLWMDGILQLAFTEDRAAGLKSRIAWQRQQGYKSDWISAEEVRDAAPGITGEILGALHAQEDGALEPDRLRAAFLQDAEAHGATISRGIRVKGIRRDGDTLTGVETDDGVLAAGQAIVAAGAWSGRLEGLPRPLSVEPIRGQMVATAWPDDEPPAIVYGPSGYLLARKGEALIGATMEHVGFDVSVTAEARDQLLGAARLVYPSLTGADAVRHWAGLRPMTPDSAPIIGPDPETTGLWYATGHGRHGILLAGLTGQILAAWMSGEPPEHDLRVVDPGRFWNW